MSLRAGLNGCFQDGHGEALRDKTFPASGFLFLEINRLYVSRWVVEWYNARWRQADSGAGGSTPVPFGDRALLGSYPSLQPPWVLSGNQGKDYSSQHPLGVDDTT